MDPRDFSIRVGTCAELLEGLARGGLSSVELASRYLAAIDASQRTINAFIAVDAARVLAEAHASDARRARGGAGALEGLPIAIKDNLDARGYVTTAGMATRRAAAPAAVDSAAVARLRASGAVILGKLNLNEAALGADNDNPHFGACHNPHRLGLTSGGSSGGAGAAVAAGLCAAALGSDSMGSIRIPASYCGVFGLKPSYGAVSTRGSVTVSRRLDHVGPLARSAGDLGLLLEVLAGDDLESPQSRRVAIAPAKVGALTIGVPALGGIDIEVAVRNAFDSAIAALAAIGHRIVALPAADPAPSTLRRAGLLIAEGEMLIEHAEHWLAARERFSPALAAMLGYAERKSARDYAAADRLLDRGALIVRRWLAACEVIAWPTTPQPAFAFGTPAPSNQADLTCLANMAGVPALSVPMPVADHALPIGLQLIGEIGSERTLLALGDAYAVRVGTMPLKPPG